MDKLAQRVRELASQRRAVILAHNYQEAAVQEVADFVGDSLELSRKAAATDAETIVFCGVYFMAETAAILSPRKTVLLPDLQAGCPMVTMAPVEAVRQLKAKHPGAIVVTYVNSSAAVKAESDICCTSANAAQIVAGLPADAEILFVPDQHLGAYVSKVTGRKMILYPGCCPTHAAISPADIAAARAAHPGAPVIAHPECRAEVSELADEVLSTSGMCRFAATSPARVIIVATETAMLHRLRKENPGKTFVPASERAVCPNMKRITLEKVAWSLEDMRYVVTVPEEIRVKALRAVERMVQERAPNAN
ncbi:MAG: quinolinate synthase NadA [Kiritimatiellae bacterium]|nr:quinolinate synthase NadA [Kiritimatiellia bacterium]